MSVSLAKRVPSFVREAGSVVDVFAHELAIAPLWWDDASYIRYQSDDGPTGYWTYELGFRPGDGPIVREWNECELDDPRPTASRSARLADEAAVVAECEAALVAIAADPACTFDPPF